MPADETLDQSNQVRCRVDHRDNGTRSVHPCGTLQSVLLIGKDSGMSGAALLPFGTRHTASHLLVIQPRRGQGSAQIANFCPFCGVNLGPNDGHRPLRPGNMAARQRLHGKVG